MIRHPGIIAAQPSVARAPLTRQYYSAEVTGQIDGGVPAGTWAELVSLEFTPDASSDYLIMWSCEIQNTITTFNGAIARLAEGGVEADRFAYAPGVDTASWSQQGSFYRHQSGASPAALRLTIDCTRVNDTFSCTPRVRNGRIIVLKLTDQDEYIDLGSQSTTSATPVDGVTLSFTPDTAGSYLILGAAALQVGVNESSWLRLYDGADATPDRHYVNGGGATLLSSVQAWWRPGLSGAQSFRLQYWVTTSAELFMRRGRILALRLDTFSHAYLTASTADEQGPDTSYVDSLTLSRVVPDKDFLAIAAFDLSRDGAGTGLRGGKFTDAFGDICEGSQEVLTPVSGGIDPSDPFFCGRLGSYLAGRREWNIERKTYSAITDTVIRENAVIALLQLN